MENKYNGKNIIGSDETGVGDYFTPLVACATFVPYQNISKLKSLGITDSKKMTDRKIMDIKSKIVPFIKYRIKYLTQEGYNKLSNSYNANELKMFLHLGAINDLENRIDDIDLIIIDQFSNKESIKRYYNRLIKSNFDFKPILSKTKLVEKGEMEHIAVATASVLARSFLLEKMNEQNKKWNTKFPLGVNSIVEKFAIEFVEQHGRNALDKVAKISFKTTKKLFGN